MKTKCYMKVQESVQERQSKSVTHFTPLSTSIRDIYNYHVYFSVHPCCSTEIRNFDGSESDRRMFLISVEQLRMNTNILSDKLYLGS
jgi:hypothetical protein